MKKIGALLLVALLTLSVGCGSNASLENEPEEKGYTTITAEDAKAEMEMEEPFLILDVRTQEEYDEGHIPEAVLVSVTDIEDRIESVVPEKSMKLLVYCRSGNRSQAAAEKLVELGYTNVYDFGGIQNWPYEIVK